jgi:integrase
MMSGCGHGHPAESPVFLTVPFLTLLKCTVMPLSDVAAKSARPREKPYKLSDSGGLYLLVNPNGARYWRMDYRFAGKRKLLALGVYPAVGLAAARKKREVAKEQLASGLDPPLAKKAEKRSAKYLATNTFETIANEWLENQRQSWTPRYAAHVLTRLQADIFPALGKRPITEINAPELLEALRKVEDRGALEIAKRLRQTCGQIFRYAIVTGRASRDPSADLKGALKPPGKPKHHRAMAKAGLPDFLSALDTYDGDPRTKYALKLITLTFVRTGELREARWDEFEDLDRAEPLWRIPASRMKMSIEHLVPLSSQALEVLAQLRSLSGTSPYLFPSPGKERVMSNNTMLYALYRMGYHGRATVHGFRALASTTSPGHIAVPG